MEKMYKQCCRLNIPPVPDETTVKSEDPLSTITFQNKICVSSGPGQLGTLKILNRVPKPRKNFRNLLTYFRHPKIFSISFSDQSGLGN
jgi:hypothetical protein